MTGKERGIRAGVRRLFRLGLHRADLARAESDDEIAFHIEARALQLMASGMSPDAARAEASRLFGDVDRARAGIGAAAERRAASLALGDRIEAVIDDFRY